MAVPLFDAATTGTAAGAGSLTFSHTTAGTDRLLLVSVSIDNRTVSGVTYGGVAMTSVGSAQNGAQISHMWRLIAPATGANNVVVTLSGGGTDIVAVATSYTVANQTTPLGTAATATGTSTTASVAVTSATDELVVDSVSSNLGTLTVGAGQTQRGNGVGGDNQGGASEEAGATSVTMSWTIGSSSAWAIVGVSIKGAATDTTVTPGTLALALTTFAAVVTVTANVLVTPATAALAISSFAPTVTASNHQTVTPSTTALTLSTFAPSIGIGVNVVPSTASLTTTGFAPTVTITDNQIVIPDTASLSTALFAPTVTVSSSQIVTPGTASLTITTFPPVVTAGSLGTVARPNADTAAGAWLPSTGTSLFAMVDEVVADDTDYIFATTATTCTLGLSPVADPLTSSGQVVEYRAWSPTGTGGVTIRLKQGAVVIASWTHAPGTLTAVPTAYQQVLTAAECDAITDYSNLFVEPVAL